MSSSLIMKILVLSDNEAAYIWDYFERSRFENIDLIISCGDLKPEYLSFLVTMIKAPLFYVHGNHDGIYLKNPPEGCNCIDGKLITYKGIRILGLGGSFKYNNGIFQYTEWQMKRRLLKVMPKIWLKRGFDMLVTHAPAFNLGDGEDICHRGFKCFTELLNHYSPSYFIHGHQHLNYSNRKRILQYKFTTIVNAYEYFILDFPK